MVRIERVARQDLSQFREMVGAYWREIMPRPVVVRDPAQWEAYSREQFAWDGGNNHPHWAIVDDSHVGFLAFEVSEEQRRARVNHVYVVPGKRRQGYGTAIVRWLFRHLDRLGIERIDLDVRRDTPDALAFWQAQGFGVAGYRLRQYRAPESGTPFVGALSSDGAFASTAPELNLHHQQPDVPPRPAAVRQSLALHRRGARLNLIAVVDETDEIIETMWGDPNRWADEQRRIHKIFLTLSKRDLRDGYSLQRLDLYGKSVWVGQDYLEPEGAQSLGLITGSIIEIRGPLYRPDTFAFGAYVLTEEEKPAYAISFRGHSIPKTIKVENLEGGKKIDRRRHLPPLSIRTARHAIGYLPEDPITLLPDASADPMAAEIFERLVCQEPEHVRREYFGT
jgi:ribosomal protein S18 acetylase RimI-like enzyme